MKTINLSVPDDLWQRARIEAAKHNTSLSALVRCYLQAMVQGQAPVITRETTEDADKQNRQALLNALQSADLVLGYPLSRSKTYER